MRFPCSLARTLSLLLLMPVCASVASADTLPVSTSPARCVQIQCTVLRARVTDVDAFGINLDLVLPKPYLSASDVSKSYAETAHGTLVAQMLSMLTDTKNPNHYSAFAAPVLVILDGQSGIISLANMRDPGMTGASRLIVIPHVHEDGTVSLFVSPRFRFVCAPGSKEDAPAATTDGFPVTVTGQSGGIMVLQEKPRPAPSSSDDLPYIGQYFAHHVRFVQSTELLVFLTVTVLPETSASRSSMEPMRHA